MRQWWRDRLSGVHRQALVLPVAFLLLTICLLHPHAVLPSRVADWFIVIDITQSMNVRDYSLKGRNVSRLEYAKQAVRDAVRGLPCGSRVALGMFTERQALMVINPLEVCGHYPALDEIVARMDWRMAWAADSFITHGLFSAIDVSGRLGRETRLMFITDGHQAPPANPKYMPEFPGKPGMVTGVILGAGKTALSPIPKLDDRNEIGGYWTHEEALRFGNFGMAETLSVLAMEQGQHDRNAGHGPGNSQLSSAHLSGLDEETLRRLSRATGLDYARLDDPEVIRQALRSHRMATWRNTSVDLRVVFGLPGLVLIVLYFVPPAFLSYLKTHLSIRRRT